MKKASVSRSCQTEAFAVADDSTKCFFRVVFEGRTLQFKLPMTTALSVMFAKVPVLGDFVWHGIVLDGSLTPLHYNMLGGEENCSTLTVVLNTRRTTTFADEVLVNDAVRAVSFRLRLQEEENEALKLEVDELQAQIFALHRELSSVVSSASTRADEERAQRNALSDTIVELQSVVKRLEAENDLLKRRRGSIRSSAPFQTSAGLEVPTHERDEGATSTDISLQCVLMDESAQEGQELAPLHLPRSATVGFAVEALLGRNAAIVPPVGDCMICVRTKTTGEYTVVDMNDSSALAKPVAHGDTLYLARMA